MVLMAKWIEVNEKMNFLSYLLCVVFKFLIYSEDDLCHYD